MAFCIQCGHRNPDDGRFCDKCGNPLVWGVDKKPQPESSHLPAHACPVCKKPSTSDKFCTNCGHKFGAMLESVPVAPAVELRLNTSSEEAVPQKSVSGDGRTRKSHLLLGVAAVGLVILGIAAYLIMSPSNSGPLPVPAVSTELQPAAPPAENGSITAPPLALPSATESPPSPVAVENPLKPAQPTAVRAVPRTAPVRPKPVPPVKESPAPLPPVSPPIAEKPAPQEVKKQFSCNDLPFGLLVACGVEGKDVIRKCAPDLKTWNHNIPGCNRQGNTTNNN